MYLPGECRKPWGKNVFFVLAKKLFKIYILNVEFLKELSCGVRHTKVHKPVKLVYTEYFDTEQEALAKEKYLKSGGGREWLKNMMNCAK